MQKGRQNPQEEERTKKRRRRDPVDVLGAFARVRDEGEVVRMLRLNRPQVETRPPSSRNFELPRFPTTPQAARASLVVHPEHRGKSKQVGRVKEHEVQHLLLCHFSSRDHATKGEARIELESTARAHAKADPLVMHELRTPDLSLGAACGAFSWSACLILLLGGGSKSSSVVVAQLVGGDGSRGNGSTGDEHVPPSNAHDAHLVEIRETVSGSKRGSKVGVVVRRRLVVCPGRFCRGGH
mmetsp:Transcript_38948/g.66315  ORF Transcript_38948/g.66315 Transcript_38948/m.66315 type:complete len:239 (-) Transcript_38948:2276-2992(-)